ncbi:hypothetical protein CS542_07635 [Pedobacter sp. IW39]|nr:hypothetical protein CS542_07635 [Pedobacter sp. IW39]
MYNMISGTVIKAGTWDEEIVAGHRKFTYHRTSSIGTSKDLMAQTDFTQPLDSNTILEFGLKAENRGVTSEFKAEQQLGEVEYN